jgi:polysaccharide biosynthesis transport protein
MPEPGAELSIRGYLHVLRRGRWWVAAGALAGLAVGLALSLTAVKQYTATAQLLVQSTGSIHLTTGAQDAITATDVQTELQLVNSAQVQNEVIKKLGSIPGVSASQVGQTNVIAVTAVAADPASAAHIANVYANAFVDWSAATTISNLAAAEQQLRGEIKAIGKQITRLPHSNSAQASALSDQLAVLKVQLAQLQVAGAAASTGLELVTPAVAPTSPSSPKPVQETLFCLMAGLVVGVGASFLRDSLDDRLATAEAVELVGGTPVLATVPMVPLLRKSTRPALVSVTDPTSEPAEAYRSLRTSLQFARHDRPMRVLMVTSPSADDGKTTVAVNLGAVFAQAGARVVLLSSDLRRPGLSQFLPPSEHAELVSVLTGGQQLERAVTPVPGLDGLWVVGARAYAGNPTELLAGQRMGAVVGELSQRFDLVIIDSPPVLPVADAMILSSYADAALLVVSSGQTRRGELRRTLEKLSQANAPVVGAVLNKASTQDEYGYYGAYQPYVLPGSGEAVQHVHGRQNGNPLPSGQHGRHDR